MFGNKNTYCLFFSPLKIEPEFPWTAVTAATSVTLSDRCRISLMCFS